jgi:hypothetical protein
MAVQKFELKSLSEIDCGRINAAFEHALARCEADCRDRPGTAKTRKVALLINMIPLCDDKGELESVNITFQIKDAIPTRESKTYNMRADRRGLLFNELSPDDIRQGTIDGPQPRSTSNAG